MADLTAAIQVNIDPKALLAELHWNESGYDDEGEVWQDTRPFNLAREVAKSIARELRDDMRKDVRDIVVETARAQVADIITETMAAGFRKTNSYGEPTGEPITLREMVVDQVKGELVRLVDGYGRPADRYNGGNLTFIEYHSRKAATEALKGEVGTAVADAVAEIKTGVKSLVTESMAAKVHKAITS